MDTSVRDFRRRASRRRYGNTLLIQMTFSNAKARRTFPLRRLIPSTVVPGLAYGTCDTYAVQEEGGNDGEMLFSMSDRHECARRCFGWRISKVKLESGLSRLA